jgi:hypothetical protein
MAEGHVCRLGKYAVGKGDWIMECWAGGFGFVFGGLPGDAFRHGESGSKELSCVEFGMAKSGLEDPDFA